MSSDGWGNDGRLGTLIDLVVALALTFAIARYGWVRSLACSRGFWFAIAHGRGRGEHSQSLP